MRKCRNWQTSKTKDLVIIAIVWVQVPSSALNNKTGTKQSVWSLSCCSMPKRALNPWFKVSPPARSARGMRSHGRHSVSAPLRSLQSRHPPDVLQPIFRMASVVVAKLYGFRSILHIRSEGEDKLMSQKKYSLLSQQELPIQVHTDSLSRAPKCLWQAQSPQSHRL